MSDDVRRRRIWTNGSLTSLTRASLRQQQQKPESEQNIEDEYVGDVFHVRNVRGSHFPSDRGHAYVNAHNHAHANSHTHATHAQPSQPMGQFLSRDDASDASGLRRAYDDAYRRWGRGEEAEGTRHRREEDEEGGSGALCTTWSGGELEATESQTCFMDAREVDAGTDEARYIDNRLYQNVVRYASDFDLPNNEDDNEDGDNDSDDDENDDDDVISVNSTRREETGKDAQRQTRPSFPVRKLKATYSEPLLGVNGIRSQDGRRRGARRFRSWATTDGSVHVADRVAERVVGGVAERVVESVGQTRRHRSWDQMTRWAAENREAEKREADARMEAAGGRPESRPTLNLDREREVITDAIMRLRRVENRLMGNSRRESDPNPTDPLKASRPSNAPNPTASNPSSLHSLHDGTEDAKLLEAEDIIDRIHDMCDQLKTLYASPGSMSRPRNREDASQSQLMRPASITSWMKGDAGATSKDPGCDLTVIREKEDEDHQAAPEAEANQSNNRHMFPSEGSSIETKKTASDLSTKDAILKKDELNNDGLFDYRRYSNLVTRENGKLQMVEMEDEMKERPAKKAIINPGAKKAVRPKFRLTAEKCETIPKLESVQNLEDKDRFGTPSASCFGTPPCQTLERNTLPDGNEKRNEAPSADAEDDDDSAEESLEQAAQFLVQDFTFKNLKSFWNNVEEKDKVGDKVEDKVGAKLKTKLGQS